MNCFSTKDRGVPDSAGPVAIAIFATIVNPALPRWQLSCVAVVLGGNCHRWQLSWMADFLGGSCPRWQLSWVAVVVKMAVILQPL